MIAAGIDPRAPSPALSDAAALDPARGTWRTLPNLPQGGSATAVVAQGRVFVATTSRVEMLSGGWRIVSPPQSPNLLAIGMAGGQWLFQQSATGQPVTAYTALDLGALRWRPVPAPPAGPCRDGTDVGVATRATLVVVCAEIGGQDAAEQAARWDPLTAAWTSLPAPALSQRFAPAIVYDGQEVLVWGGEISGGFGGPAVADGATLTTP